MKVKFNNYSPFTQASILFIIGVVAFSVFSMAASLWISWLYPEMLTSSIETQISQFSIQYMAVNFLPVQLGIMLTPGLIYLYLEDKSKKVITSINYKFVIWSVPFFTCIMLLLPFLSEINVTLVKWFGAYEGLMRQKEMSDDLLKTLVGEVGSSSFYFGILVIGVVTGIAEELAFRRFLFHHMLSNTKRLGLSIISSSIIFALLHFNYLQMIPIFVFGVVLALIYYASGSIIISMIAHAANNILNLYWLITGNFPSWLERIELKTTIPSIIILMGLLIYFHKRK